MKRTGLLGCSLSFLIVFCFETYCFAQTKVSDFGYFTVEELNMKECSFDKTADAVVLFDQAVSNYNDDYNLITDRRVRIKILKEKGIERGNIHIRFYSKSHFEFIKGINGVTASNESDQVIVTKLDPKTVFTRKLDELYSEVVFAMPNVKAGSIIEYEYESVMEHYGGLQDWYFQNELPVILSSYKLYILPNVVFNYAVKKNTSMPITIQPDNSTGSILFEMRNVPGLRDEAYSTSYRDYLQRVNFQLSEVVSRTGSSTKYSNNWKELTRDFTEDKDFGAQVNKNISIPESLLWTSNSDAYAKMRLIHNYVRKNFQWNDIYSLYAMDGLKTVVDKKKGSSGELNLLLINLLKDAGLNAYPMLVSERWHGKVDTSFSLQDQFNKVVALVYINDKMYVLDATDDVTPSNMIPENLLNTIGFLVDRKNFGFVHLIDNTKSRLSSIELNGTVDTSGSVKVNAAVDYYDYARVGKVGKYNSNKQKYIGQFESPVTDFKIDSFNISGTESDSVKLHHDLLVHYALNKSGSYYLLNYNLFTDFDKNPFLADYRFTDIDFGTKYTCIWHGKFELPDALTLDALPKDLTLRTPDKDLQFARQIVKSGNTIEISLRIDFKKILYRADDYYIVKDFFTKMTDLLNEPLVLKAK